MRAKGGRYRDRYCLSEQSGFIAALAVLKSPATGMPSGRETQLSRAGGAHPRRQAQSDISKATSRPTCCGLSSPSWVENLIQIMYLFALISGKIPLSPSTQTRSS